MPSLCSPRRRQKWERKLVDIFGLYGIPLEVLTDEGKEFCNNIAKQLFDKLGIVHTVAAPHAHQTVGLVERANRDIRQYMRLYNTREDWDLFIRPMMHAFNAAYCVPIGRSPAELMFGRHFMYPMDFQIMAQSEVFLNVPDWERQLDEDLKESAGMDQANKSKMKERFESQSGKGGDKAQLTEGDLVLYDPEDRSAGWKNVPAWQGPFEVLSSERDGQRVTISFDGKRLTRGARYFKRYLGDDSESEKPTRAPSSPSAGDSGLEENTVQGALKAASGFQPAVVTEKHSPQSDVVGLSESSNDVSASTLFPPKDESLARKREEPDEERESSAAGPVLGATRETSTPFGLVMDLQPISKTLMSDMKKPKVDSVPTVEAAEYPRDFVVDDVLAVRDVGDVRHFRIRWENYSPEFNMGTSRMSVFKDSQRRKSEMAVESVSQVNLVRIGCQRNRVGYWYPKHSREGEG